MKRPRPWSHDAIESIAVPSWDLVDDIGEAIGQAGAALLPHRHLDEAWLPRSNPIVGPQRVAEPEAPPAPIPSTKLCLYPPIGRQPPWGADESSPMGEGSEDTAVPRVDPAELRLAEERQRPGAPDQLGTPD
jgi:hypothetical protein